MKIEQKIEAILFWKGEPMSRRTLSEILKIGDIEINEAIDNLKISLENRGIVLVEKDNDITLGTAVELTEMIGNLQKEELNKDLTKASMETLAIILYKNGVNRAEIDYIRGVNSSFILRALSIRGLVDKIVDPGDNRRFIYKPSFDLLSYMGVKAIEELPEYLDVNNSIKNAVENFIDETKIIQDENTKAYEESPDEMESPDQMVDEIKETN